MMDMFDDVSFSFLVVCVLCPGYQPKFEGHKTSCQPPKTFPLFLVPHQNRFVPNPPPPWLMGKLLAGWFRKSEIG